MATIDGLPDNTAWSDTDELLIGTGSTSKRSVITRMLTWLATKAVKVAAGTVGAPGLQVGDADTGLYQTSTKLHAAVDGTEVWRAITGGLALGAGFDPTEALHLRRTGTSVRILLESESGATFIPARYTNDASPPTFACRKYRGTIASPAVISSLDRIFSLEGHAYDGTTLRNPIEIRGQVVAATPSSTNMEARFLVMLAPASSVTASEVVRIDHATGLSMFGANPVIDQDRGIQKRSRTVAELGSLTPTAGREFYCSNESGGAVPVFGDGTNWRRVTDRAVIS